MESMDEDIVLEEGIGKKKQIKVPTTLWRSKLSLHGDTYPSVGEIQGNRIALISQTLDEGDVSAFIATKSKILLYKAKPSSTFDANGTGSLENIQESKIESTHQEEIISLRSKQTNDSIILGSVDSKGFANVKYFSKGSLQESSSFTAQPTVLGESGWNGIDLHPSHSSTIVVANMFAKRITIYDQDRAVKTFHTPQNPTQIRYVTLPNTNDSLIATTEYNQLTIWDPRSNNPCLKRLAPSTGAFYALDAIQDAIAVGGASRNVHIYDPRKWSQIGSWAGCLKYEITHLHFASGAPLCFVGGLDSALACGEWKGNFSGNKYSSILGDSRWIGLDKSNTNNIFAGFTEQGNMYLINYNLQNLIKS